MESKTNQKEKKETISDLEKEIQSPEKVVKENKAVKEVCKIKTTVKISFKYSVEMCKNLKGKNLKKGVLLIERVKNFETALKLKRFVKDMPHRRGSEIISGRYPIKVCGSFLKILNGLEKNAENKGMDTEKLVITRAMSNRAFSKTSAAKYKRGKLTTIWLEATEK